MRTVVIAAAAIALGGCVIVIDSTEGKSALDVHTVFNNDGRDGDLARAVRDAFVDEPSLAHADLRVSADDGVVRLRGRVADAQQMERAVAIAQRVEGVSSVESRLTVEN